ncbi:MAG: potassium channel family protein [Hyphomicrobiales bacterium]
MSLTSEILWGSALLGLCTFVHLAIVICGVKILHAYRDFPRSKAFVVHFGITIGTALLCIVAAHTLQVWIWAGTFLFLQRLPDLESAVYFPLATYTTVGYGDVVAQIGWRVLAAIASVTGLLSFGISTAFLVGVFAKILPEELE